MKKDFLNAAIERDAAVTPKREQVPGKKMWDDKTVETTVKVFTDILDERNRLARMDLERRVRSGTGVREFRGRCCGDPNMEEPIEEQDIVTHLLRNFTKPSSLRDMVVPVMEKAADVFGKVKEKGLRDGMKLDSDTEVQVLRDVVKEALILHIIKCINLDNSGVHASGSHDAGLLATPQGYTAGALENLEGDLLKGLMTEGYGFQDGFMDENTTLDILQELELLDFDGKLVQVQQQKMSGYRTDRIAWLTLEGLDREKQPGLTSLFKKMISVPFELNKKCNLYLQAGGSFQVACYPEGAFYRKHVDGGYLNLNNGRKITAIFYPNSWSPQDGGHLRMYKRRLNPMQIEKAKKEGVETPLEDAPDEEDTDIEPLGGRLVLFRSRDMPHEVLRTGRKRYAISLWVMGPIGPGDQPDHCYTPT